MRNAMKRTPVFMLNESNLLFGDIRDKTELIKCRMVPTNELQCNVKFSNRSVVTTCRFNYGDIIEVCPVRKISKHDMFSRRIRDMAFEVVPDEEYVIPLGYCQCYDIVDKWHPVPNCAYEWDARRKCVIIRATENIEKGDVLVLDLER